MRNKQDLLFLGIGIALAGALIVALFYSISFLLLKINTALNIDMNNNNRLIRIDLGSLKSIQIGEKAESAVETMEATVNGAVKKDFGITD